MKNAFLTLVLFTFFSACAPSGVSTNPTDAHDSSAVEGLDISGSYRLSGLECYDNTGSTRTAVALLDPGYTSSITVAKNTYVSQTAGGVGGCTATSKGKIVFDNVNYILTLTSSTNTTSTGSDCTFNFSFTMATSGSITPTSFSSTEHNNSPASTTAMNALRNPTTGDFGVLSIVQRVGSPTDYCFLIFTKL